VGALTAALIELVQNHSGWVAPIVFALAFCESLRSCRCRAGDGHPRRHRGMIVERHRVPVDLIAATIGAVAGDWLAYGLAA
jgi:membrane protein DedA with SNARE-associated domain